MRIGYGYNGRKRMIDRNEIYRFVEKQLDGTGLFPVDVSVGKDNDIVVEIAGEEGVSIDTCIELTQAIEGAFDRDKEDYSLEVGSAGLTSPFKVPRQYAVNRGAKVEVLTVSGEKLHGVLGASDAEGFELMLRRKLRPEGSKRPVEETFARRLGYDDVKYTRCEIEF